MTKKSSQKIAYIGDAFFEAANSRYWAELVRGVQERSAQHGVEIVVIPSQQQLDLDIVNKVDGILLGTMEGTSYFFDKFLPTNFPCVSVVNDIPGRSAVLFDDYASAETATNYLISLGHKRILFFMEHNSPHAPNIIRQRMKGYTSALTSAGIAFDQSLLVDPVVPFITETGAREVFAHQGRNVALEWFRENLQLVRPTAVLAQNDPLAIGLIKGLREIGIAVPDTLSVVGFDGVECYEEIGLTTMVAPLYELGAKAVETVLGQFVNYANGRDVGIEKILCPSLLSERKTTGLPNTF
jgi:LacI family transcriptional regulator